MLTLPPTVRIFLAPGVTDMRKSFDGLAAATTRVIRKDPLSGHVFVFCNRRRHLLKVLLWDSCEAPRYVETASPCARTVWLPPPPNST